MPTQRDHYVCSECGAFADFSGPVAGGVMCPACIRPMAHERYVAAPDGGFVTIASDAIPDGLRHIDALMRRNGRHVPTDDAA